MKKVKKKKLRKLPSIYRYIPDRIVFFKTYRRLLKGFTIFIFFLAVVLVGYDLYKNIGVKKKIGIDREKLMGELRFWEKFLAKHKDYRDAYFQASVLEYKLGNVDMAKFYVKEGLSLDPNSQSGKKIQQFLEEN